MAMTDYEANLVLLMDLALQSGRLNQEAPNFTARGMAGAIDGLRGVTERPNEYDVAGLLDQMGVFADGRHKRSTQKLSQVLPRWSSQAISIIEESDKRPLVPTIPPHPNATRWWNTPP